MSNDPNNTAPAGKPAPVPAAGGATSPPTVTPVDLKLPDVPAMTDPAQGMRRTAQWTLGAFAAVGTTLFAGLTIAQFGSVAPDSSSRLLAALAFLIAVIGIVAAVMLTTSVLSPSVYTSEQMIRDLERMKAEQNATNKKIAVPEFWPYNDPVEAYDAYLHNKNIFLTDQDDIKKVNARNTAFELRHKLQRWQQSQALAQLQGRYDSFKRWVWLPILLTTLGALGYAFLIQSPKAVELQRKEMELTQQELKLQTARLSFDREKSMMPSAIKADLKSLAYPLQGSFMPAGTELAAPFSGMTCGTEILKAKEVIPVEVQGMEFGTTYSAKVKFLGKTVSCQSVISVDSKMGTLIVEVPQVTYNWVMP